MINIEEITNRLIDKGDALSVDEVMQLDQLMTTDQLCELADQVRRRWCNNRVHTCSIVNARSGRCGEDCKWCAQSAHHKTGVEEYEHISREDMLAAYKANKARGVQRFSMVTSGRKMQKQHMSYFCQLYREAAREGGMELCASMGLLGREELQMLWDAGVRRYHCNLESSRRHFGRLCTTHSIDDKLQTIKIAREIGFEVCSGGIIGMGEDRRDRVELAAMANAAGAVSIPVNILNPIKGTPLENIEQISEEEIVRSVALMRLAAPRCTLHFAGGRARLSQAASERMLRGGINGALVGDMLTTIGNKVDADRELFERAGYEL